MVHSFSLFQPRSRQPRSEVASGEETAFMVEPSDATPQNPSDADLLVGETVANAIHQVPQYAVVRDENELEQPCVPEAGESCEAVLHDDALRLEIETEDLMNPNRILIALLALNGGVTSSEDCIPGEPHYHSDDPRRGSIRRSLLNFGGSDQAQAEEAGDQVCSPGLGPRRTPAILASPVPLVEANTNRQGCTRGVRQDRISTANGWYARCAICD